VYTKIIAAIIVGISVSIAVLGQDAAQDAKQKATKAADSWLLLLDEGKYAESWESSASLARNKVSKGQWVQSIGSARSDFGNLIKRRLKTQEYATSLPGAPDGQYVIIQYETSFQKKKSAVETVTPMLDSDGHWRVSGYFIK